MIFASDLDQTLIFSDNFLHNNYPNPEEIKATEATLIEYYNGKPLCYMGNKTLSQLQTLDAKSLFVPVTTRTKEQYDRIEFEKHGIVPKYVITTNGAKIYKDGTLDIEWSEIIQHYRWTITQLEHIKAVIRNTIPVNALKMIRDAEGMFIYCVCHMEYFDTSLVDVLRNKLSDLDIQISFQGRKIYFIPNKINKGEAIKYVAKALSKDSVLSAGDSLLDLSMAQISKKMYVPLHGEIVKKDAILPHNVEVKQCIGIVFSQKLLEEVSNYKQAEKHRTKS